MGPTPTDVQTALLDNYGSHHYVGGGGGDSPYDFLSSPAWGWGGLLGVGRLGRRGLYCSTGEGTRKHSYKSVSESLAKLAASCGGTVLIWADGEGGPYMGGWYSPYMGGRPVLIRTDGMTVLIWVDVRSIYDQRGVEAAWSSFRWWWGGGDTVLIWAALIWAEVRWCSAAWGGRSGQSCWRGGSCSPPGSWAPGRPGR